MLRLHLLRGSRFLTNKSQLRFVKVKQDACSPIRQASQAVNVLEKVDGYKPGDKIRGFTVEQVVPVPELYLTAVKLNHDKTGAQYLHIARDDTNNVFSVSFRTTPMDSTGVPHILEHTTLCGSQKYPCRDPFFKMLNRSLSTFMNAWTASDYTMYPFSTMNSQDFDNLLSVYLDAAFFPRLRELDFSQEGWRLEHENNKDSNSPIIFKGVVFNEMKGALTSPESIFGLHSQNKLLPSHTYSHNSGGEPLDIPDLTWEQLKNFHATHYHPSNARFYTYGNLPMEKHLEQIDQKVLQKYERIEPGTEVPDEVRWTEPREFHVHCAPDPMAADPEKQTTVSINYLLGSVTDQFESFVMSFVASLLVHGPPAPFYKSLLSSNIGSDYSTGTGFCGSTKDATFGVGLQGIKEEDVEKVKQLIEQTFDEVIASGFEAERIEAILHMIELSQKHQSTSFGLGIVSSLMSSWNHDRDPVISLQVNKQVERFKQCLADDPNFLQDKVRQYFKENTHKMTLVMTPKEDFKKEIEDAEQKKLAGMVAGLTGEDKETLYKKGLELEEQQNMEEDLSCLPTLKVSDISPELPVRTHFDLTNIAGVQVQCSEQPTNGVTYFRGLSSLKNLPQELIRYVPLFSGVITRMGAGDMSFQELSQREELKTGGLSMGTHLCQYHSDILSYEQGLALSSYSLDRNISEMFSLWTEIFNRPNMTDNERLATLVRMSASDLAMSLAHAGHSYAMQGACSSLSPVGRLKEIMGGMTQVTFMKGIAEAEDMTETMTKLQEVAKHVLSKENIRCAINSSPEFMTSAVKQLESFLETLPGNAGSESVFLKQESDFAPSQLKNHYELPFPVNYMSRGVHTVPYTHPDYPALRVLARLMSSKFLHREIREKGGAYGGGAAMGTDGVFKFYSYRDPNSAATLESFSRSVEWGVKGDYTQQQIDEAKLAIFSDVDGPVAPASKGMTYFLSRISDDMRQAQREGLFAVNKQNLIDVAQRYLTPATQVTSEAFLGPANPMSQDASQGWTVHKETM